MSLSREDMDEIASLAGGEDDLEKQTKRERTARKVPLYTKERKWEAGELYKSPKGEFLVLRSTPTGYLVEYRSGKWAGKFIDMPKVAGEKITTVEGLKLKKEEQEKLLDVFYDEYTAEFNSIYSHLGGNRGVIPTTASMVILLRETYPPLFQQALNKYLDKEKKE